MDIEKNTLVYIPTHLYNRRKEMYKDIRIVSWPFSVNCKPVFGCYIKGNYLPVESRNE